MQLEVNMGRLQPGGRAKKSFAPGFVNAGYGVIQHGAHVSAAPTVSLRNVLIDQALYGALASVWQFPAAPVWTAEHVTLRDVGRVLDIADSVPNLTMINCVIAGVANEVSNFSSA